MPQIPCEYIPCEYHYRLSVQRQDNLMLSSQSKIFSITTYCAELKRPSVGQFYSQTIEMLAILLSNEEQVI